MKKNDPQTFYERLVWGLESRGHARPSQKFIAGLIGKNQSQASRWKNDGTMPDAMSEIVHLARHAGISVEWLLSGRGPRRPLPKIGDEEEELLFLFSKMDPERREDCLKHARYLRTISFAADPSSKPAPR